MLQKCCLELPTAHHLDDPTNHEGCCTWFPRNQSGLCVGILDNLRSRNCLTYFTASLVFGWQFSSECQSDIQNIVLLLIGAFNQQPAVCRHTKPEIFCIPKKNVALFTHAFWERLWMLDTVAIKGNFFMNLVIFFHINKVVVLPFPSHHSGIKGAHFSRWLAGMNPELFKKSVASNR